MHNLLQQLPGVIFEYIIPPDKKGKFTFVSANCIDIIGLRSEDIIEDPQLLTTVIIESERQSFEDSIKDSLQQQVVWSWEGQILINEEERWIEAKSNYQEVDGTIIRKGIIMDINDRKKREQESEFRYQSLVEHLPLGVGVHVAGQLVFANKYAYEIMGAKQNELLGKNVLEFVHPDYKEEVLSRIKRVMMGEVLPMAEEKYVRLDGKIIDVQTGAIPFVYKGAMANQIIVMDVTERKKVEKEIKKNETLFSQLFHSVPIGVVMLDENNKVKLINKGFVEMFGYELSDLEGQNLNDFIVPNELRVEGVDLNNLISNSKVISVETIRKHRNGHMIDVLLYGVPVMFEDSTIGIYGVYVNITDRKKVEEELKVRNTELDQFVYKVSHDLRAPLSSILGLVNLAKMSGNTDNPMDYIDIIGEKVSSLDRFIGDVLSHSKNLKMEMNVTKIDFHTLISRAFTDLSYLEGAADMMVYRKVEGGDFFSDIWRISEIFRNLISNAIKYRQSAIEPEISIDVEIDDNQAKIVFTDNGIGIDEESLLKVFEMFYRATEQSNGSGIGLYIVKNAVDKLNGKITVDSKVNYGTTFTLVLPNQIHRKIANGPLHFEMQKQQ